MYDESTDTMLHGTGQETFEAVKMLKAANPAHYQPAPGVVATSRWSSNHHAHATNSQLNSVPIANFFTLDGGGPNSEAA